MQKPSSQSLDPSVGYRCNGVSVRGQYADIHQAGVVGDIGAPLIRRWGISVYRCMGGISVYRCIGAAQIGNPRRRHNELLDTNDRICSTVDCFSRYSLYVKMLLDRRASGGGSPATCSSPLSLACASIDWQSTRRLHCKQSLLACAKA